MSPNISSFPVRRDLQTRLPRRVLRFYGFGVAPREKRDACAADSARSASLRDYRQPINPTGRKDCAEGRHPP